MQSSFAYRDDRENEVTTTLSHHRSPAKGSDETVAAPTNSA
jgi:hypothetical protein